MASAPTKDVPGILFAAGTRGSRPARARLEPDALNLDVDGESRALPLDRLHLSLGGDGKAKLVLKVPREDGEDVLYVDRTEGAALLRGAGVRALDARLDELDAERRRDTWTGLGLWGGLAGVCLAGLVLVVVALDLAVAWAMDRVPPSWEVQLGATLVGSLTEGKEIRDPVVQDGLEVLTDRLLAAVGETPYRFRFHVIEDETTNAFALPGGQVVILSGLLERAESPEEVAGVLAHEIQHVLQRHSLRRIFDHLRWHLLLTMVIGDVETLTEVILARASGLLTLAYDRAAEREADRKGLDLLYAARIDPEGLVRFFEKLAEDQGTLAETLTILSTHPGGNDRVQYLRGRIEERAQGAFEPLALDWEQFQSALKGATQ